MFHFESLVLRKFRKITAISHPCTHTHTHTPPHPPPPPPNPLSRDLPGQCGCGAVHPPVHCAGIPCLWRWQPSALADTPQHWASPRCLSCVPLCFSGVWKQPGHFHTATFSRTIPPPPPTPTPPPNTPVHLLLVTNHACICSFSHKSKCWKQSVSAIKDFFAVFFLTWQTHHEQFSCFIQLYNSMTAQVLAFPWPSDLERISRSFQLEGGRGWGWRGEGIRTVVQTAVHERFFNHHDTMLSFKLKLPYMPRKGVKRENMCHHQHIITINIASTNTTHLRLDRGQGLSKADRVT